MEHADRAVLVDGEKNDRSHEQDKLVYIKVSISSSKKLYDLVYSAPSVEKVHSENKDTP